jgi:hypothetical protein
MAMDGGGCLGSAAVVVALGMLALCGARFQPALAKKGLPTEATNSKYASNFSGIIELRQYLPSIQGALMAAQKPRGNDGPLEAERELKGPIILKIPVEGGGRIQVSLNDAEAKDICDKLLAVIK